MIYAADTPEQFREDDLYGEVVSKTSTAYQITIKQPSVIRITQ